MFSTYADLCECGSKKTADACVYECKCYDQMGEEERAMDVIKG